MTRKEGIALLLGVRTVDEAVRFRAATAATREKGRHADR
jgi:hypothetical protein